MSKKIIIEVNGKEYKLGFPNRDAAKVAEKVGFSVFKLENEYLTQTDKLFYAGLLSYHPSMTEREANKLKEKYSEEGDIEEVIQFLAGEFSNFMKPKAGKKKAKIEEA